MGNASATLVGQNLGAKQPARAERSAWLAGGLAMCLMFAGFVPALIWAERMIGVFNPSPEVVTVGAACLRILALAWGIGALGTVMSQSLSGAGDTITAMVVSLLTQWAILLPLAYGLARLLETNGIWTAIALTSVANAAILSTLFSRGRWKLVTV